LFQQKYFCHIIFDQIISTLFERPILAISLWDLMGEIVLLPRLQPCCLLDENNIPCAVWFEIALRHYNVPTEIFELYVLVPDIEQAVTALVQYGWTLLTKSPAKIGNAYVDVRQHRLVPPALPNDMILKTSIPPEPTQNTQTATETVILPASDWKFTFSDDKKHYNGYLPDLPEFFDALIDTLLDAPLDDSTFWIHIACQIGYLYSYNSVVKERSFAQSLRYEHRQFHLDSLSEMRTGTAPFIKNQRVIREGLRHGLHTLCDCSASCDNVDLFPTRREKELLQVMFKRNEE
jgi:hypothetical protein